MGDNGAASGRAGSPIRDRLTAAVLRPAGAVALVLVVGFPLLAVAWAIVSLAAHHSPTDGIAGPVLAAVALGCGAVFFTCSVRYYAATVVVLSHALRRHRRWGTQAAAIAHENGVARIAHAGNGERTGGYGLPFISVQVASYNEERVIGRVLECLANLVYPNYEVIVVDDSTDGSAAVLDRFRDDPRFTIIHRLTRSGFKGGALSEALKVMDPRAEYVCIFDADAMPFPDVIQSLLPHFFVNGGDNPVRRREDVAAVQSYQWHVLNKEQSWLTEAVRVEYAGSYMVERPFQDVFGALKMVAGTAYMIRADILREVGWGTSITEDWQLTCRLYARGNKVVYTPYGETPAECVDTFRRLVKQRMRWAEGHSYNVRRHLGPIMRSPLVTGTEKLEFAYYSLYYLQAVLFVLGTAAWAVSDLVLHAYIPDWTTALGWSLVAVNSTSVPLMNAAGLMLEGAPRRDYRGVAGAAFLSVALVPFQAWAALKGLFESDEGTWNRTPKTGKVTHEVEHLLQRRWLGAWIKDARRRRARRHPETLGEPLRAGALVRRPWHRLAVGLALLIGIGTGVAVVASSVTVADSAGPAWHVSGAASTAVRGADTLTVQAGAPARVSAGGDDASAVDFVASTVYRGGTLAAGTATITLPFTATGCTVAHPCRVSVSFGYCRTQCATRVVAVGFPVQVVTTASGTLRASASGAATPLTGCPCYLVLRVRITGGGGGEEGGGGVVVLAGAGTVTPPSIAAPERWLLIVGAAALCVPLGARRLARRRARGC